MEAKAKLTELDLMALLSNDSTYTQVGGVGCVGVWVWMGGGGEGGGWCAVHANCHRTHPLTHTLP
jgi:hypothetical protein